MANLQVPSNPGTPVDLIGQIGLGNAISAETGWSYVKDSTLTYNNANGDPVTGKVINYIVQEKCNRRNYIMVLSGCRGHQIIHSSGNLKLFKVLLQILIHLL